MEGRESTVSNSTANTESDSPVSGAVPSGGLVPQAMNMAVNMSMERSLGGGVVGGVDMMMGKKKRGRPRKYAPDGSLALVLSQGYSSPPSPDFSAKRGRGRPPGSGNRQLLASLGDWVANTAGGNFMPHVVTISTGEDVADKIFSFAQKGPRAICILSANGSVSNVTIRQPGYCGGILTYEGRFEILSLSGSYSFTETGGGIRNRTGGLSVSLAGPDGRVIGGVVAGLLLAASPIQVVVGSFMPNYKPHKKKYQNGYPIASVIPVIQGSPDIVTAARPISQARPDDGNCVTPTSALPEQSHGEEENSANSNPNPNSGFQSADWHASESKQEKKVSPDINACAPGE
ncbi:AT-hook motif nuclear-localized protein 1-like [Telopea speciosissima]|uniref:AT-hook motif nuclear-localized protein 1-like n=1 Tax=Telopea speciosissima TaxID=54955 RepID=UPI001CC6A4B1|nr:AT-hook motif nuclear-localized protein 1-like [Telopea speciosissima]